MSILDKHPAPWTIERWHGVDDYQPKERRKSSLREQRAELLAALECMVLARRDNGDESAGLRDAEALIARIKGGK